LKLKTVAFFIPFFLSFLIVSVRAAVDILETDAALGVALGVGEFIGGLILSLGILVLFVELPIIILTKGKQYSLYVLLGISGLAVFTALGWFPIWVMIIIVLGIAFGAGKQIAEFLGGLRR